MFTHEMVLAQERMGGIGLREGVELRNRNGLPTKATHRERIVENLGCAESKSDNRCTDAETYLILVMAVNDFARCRHQSAGGRFENRLQEWLPQRESTKRFTVISIRLYLQRCQDEYYGEGGVKKQSDFKSPSQLT